MTPLGALMPSSRLAPYDQRPAWLHVAFQLLDAAHAAARWPTQGLA